MTPRKYAQTFGLIALLVTSLLIPIVVGRRSGAPAVQTPLDAPATAVAQQH